MNSELIQVKVYLEGIPIPVNRVTIISGQVSEARIDLSHINKYIPKFKAGTLGHIFIFYEGAWRLFFAGRLSGNNFGSTHSSLHFRSLFTELQTASIVPITAQSSTWGHAAAILYASTSEREYRGKEKTEVLILTSGNVEFFNFEKLQETGDIDTYIYNLLDAAKFVSPWYRIQEESFNLNSGYYILSNPRIFQITKAVVLDKLINGALADIGSHITYENILKILLKQLRYKKFELNTPIKIDGEWRWVLLLPDPSWLKPFTEEKLSSDKIAKIAITDRTENYTRVLLTASFPQTDIDIIQKSGTHFLFAEGKEKPYMKNDAQFYIKFTEEEKYSGVRPYSINLDSEESMYSMINWSNVPIDKLDKGTSEKLINEGVSQQLKYVSQIGEYKYEQLKNSSIEGTQIVPVYNLNLLPIFPITLDLSDEFKYDVNIDTIAYTISAEGNVNINLNIANAMFNDEERKQLDWNPTEYTDGLEDFYKQFEHREMITEKEYWETIGVYKKKYWRKSANLDATFIANLDIEDSLFDDYLKTPLVYERAKPVANYYQEIYGVELELPEPPEGVDMRLLDKSPITAGARPDEDKDKKEKTKGKPKKKTKSKVTTGRKPVNFNVAMSRFKANKTAIIEGIKAAKTYLESNKQINNSYGNITKVLDAIQTEEEFQEFYACWVQAESSWNSSAINTASKDYGLYQINTQHDAKGYLNYVGGDEIKIKELSSLSIKEQTKRVALAGSLGFTYSAITSNGSKAKNGGYGIWYL